MPGGGAARPCAVCGYTNEPPGDRARPFYAHGTGGRVSCRWSGGAGAVKGTAGAGGGGGEEGGRPVFPTTSPPNRRSTGRRVGRGRAGGNFGFTAKKYARFHNER